MSDRERAYAQGERSALTGMLLHILGKLGADYATVPRLRLREEQTRAALRGLCADLGCNDWEDSLHLADVIEKHLRPAVQELQRREDSYDPPGGEA